MWTVGKNGERITNAFETRRWRRMLQIKWTDRITNDCSFSKGKRRKITSRNFKKQTPLMERAYS